ncbi:MAG: polysaccharide biosynthesis C-terminal domain-containing protein [Actinobacteria bacterium]|nr:polysaccharide biosynthesis C-terminal domain-containing protein [Actinomycetota bacterium]
MAEAGTTHDGTIHELDRLARGGTLNLAGGACKAAAGLVLVLVVTRGLGAGGAGVFFEAVAVFMILSNTAELGADTGLVRFVSGTVALGRVRDLRGLLAAALWPVALVGAVMAVGVFAAAGVLGGVFTHGSGAGEVAAYLRTFAVFVPVAAVVTVLLAGTRGFGVSLPLVAVQEVGIPLLRLLLVALVVAGGLGSTAVALGWAVPLLLGLAPAAWATRRLLVRAEGRSAAPPRPSRVVAREFWRFAAPRGAAAFVQITILWVDVLLVGALAGARAAGIYAAASRAAILGTLALEAVRVTIAPQISGLLARGARGTAQVVYQTATWWLVAMSWPLYLTLALFPELPLSVFGPGFEQGAAALTILALGMLVNLGTGNNTTVLLMGGRSSWALANSAAALSTNVVLNVALIPRFGIAGAAFAWVVSIAVENVAASLQLQRFMGLRPLGGGYGVVTLSATVAFGALGLVARTLAAPSWPLLALVVAAGCGLHAGVLWRYRELLRLRALAALVRRRAPGGGPAEVTAATRTGVSG